MASAPQSPLPLFYTGLQPLSSQIHGDYKVRQLDHARFFATQNVVPLTIEEFLMAQRHYPIVFSTGDNPVPLALMGLSDGVNVFTDADGRVTENVYVPAYVRRYPFLLAALGNKPDEMSLCFDPNSEAVGAFEDGTALFEGPEPSTATREILGFCEQYEGAAQRSYAFMRELIEHKLLMDGELTIQVEGGAEPFVFRGFSMVDENKLRELRGDVLRKIMQSGLLPLIHAHLFSLPLARDVFARQLAQGRAPQRAPEPNLA